MTVSERDVAVLRSFARRIDPSDAGAHNNLGVLYYQKGLVPEAIEQFTRALELDPRMQVAQRNLEIAYHNTGYYDRRVAELQEKLRQAPDERDPRWELGRTYAIWRWRRSGSCGPPRRSRTRPSCSSISARSTTIAG